ncbi:MAG: HAD-IA family hydrolase [Prevotella sp.]|nr:HAD-IA family hydrolase [Prevotella sp.]
MNGIRLIIFDFDGTLGDTRRNILLTMRQTLEELSLPVACEEECAATIGLPLRDCFLQLFPDLSDELADRCAATYRRIFDINKKQLVPALFPHVRETLAELYARGYILTVASSRSSASLREFLSDMGVINFISLILGADDVARAKPDPEPVLQTLRTLKIPASETLVVGDMPVDILMGARAGARTCAVTYGNASATDLRAAGADVLIDDFAQLLD